MTEGERQFNPEERRQKIEEILGYLRKSLEWHEEIPRDLKHSFDF